MEACIITAIITSICSVLASSGFWAYMQKKSDSKDLKTAMIIGLAHDRIMSLGGYYIERQYITTDEYENLRTYLYEPYAALGGNGSAKRIMDEVDKLELRNTNLNKEET